MIGRFPLSRTPSGRPFVSEYYSYAVVRVSATGGGEKIIEGLYFIDEPLISIQGILATHVTVKSPTHNYTASLLGIADEERIDRFVNIDEGDSAVCQEIAETLLAKWGREQLSVSGKLPLNLSLNFKEEVRTILYYTLLWIIDTEISLSETFSLSEEWETWEPAGDWFLSDLLGAADTGKPDEQLVLQRKSHTLTDYATGVNLGDTQLDDNELVARILEKLEG